jgi:hypothetical protein
MDFHFECPDIAKPLSEIGKFFFLRDIVACCCQELNSAGFEMKGTSKIKADVNRDIIAEYVRTIGLAGVAMISSDDTWPALRILPLQADCPTTKATA